jgi:hypothetical protein
MNSLPLVRRWLLDPVVNDEFAGPTLRLETQSEFAGEAQ